MPDKKISSPAGGKPLKAEANARPTSKSRKNRRKHKKKAPDNGADSAHSIAFSIRAIINPQFGFVARCKDTSAIKRKINLQPFIPTGSSCYVFESNLRRLPQVTCSKSDLNESSTMNQANFRNGRQRNPTPNKEVKTDTEQFPPYITKEEAILGVESGHLHKGIIRINPNRFTDAYCPSSDRNEPDFYIMGVANRNRALEGDVVVLKLLPESEWGTHKKVSVVVFILERVHSRLAAGYLSLRRRDGRLRSIFTPRDKRVPCMFIDKRGLPSYFYQNPKLYECTLFIAELVDWISTKYSFGRLKERCGESLDLAAENRAILLENNIQFGPFPPRALQDLPDTYELTRAEIDSRLDLRSECVFTIDPLTARDLDDALHIATLPNGNYEIGVHIADVSYYLHEDSYLDQLVAKRATSTYLVDAVYHMLPKELCMACSLLPGKDCAAFSVIWEMTDDGTILATKYARTVINNCTQLAYEHAQWMIENPDATSFNTDLPKIERFSAEDIRKRVLILHRIAQQMRKRRYDNGALHITQTKLSFRLDSSGMPVELAEQEIKQANNLIEEFMLQANISVAERIYHVFPDLAFLRNHDEPNPRMIKAVRDKLELIGIHLNFDTSWNIHQSIQSFKQPGQTDRAKYVGINHMLTKPMTRAQYFCANGIDFGHFRHYALSIPIYTHFTSPIRRYADVVVHRLLAAALGLRDKPTWSAARHADVATTCNTMKYNAKKAGEASGELMLARYVQRQQFVANAVVVHVGEKYFQAVLLTTGTVLRIFTDNIEKAKVDVESIEGPEDTKIVKWNVRYLDLEGNPIYMQVIDLFQIVWIKLTTKPRSLKLYGVLVHPRNGQCVNVG